ncbi:DNA repair protein RecO [Patescibacteria group bacterium]|nr:DNA repair protein RecO [Patescibacteria group bacterium]MBU1062608.1 DNA repair protein RecO [Patescibacteria group bacterium]
MEETYRVKAVVLYRSSFGENNTIVTIYTTEKGKLELIARGTKKSKSKLAAHLEPITLVDVMVVRGKKYDYIGSAISENCYFDLKNSLEKIKAAGEVIRILNLIVKTGDCDKEIFELLISYFDFLNSAKEELNYDLFVQLFVFKLLIKLGHRPELYYCVSCHSKILPLSNKFDLSKGGIICVKCFSQLEKKYQLIISENSIKILRLAIENDFKQLANISVNKDIKKEIINIINSFFKYNFN